MQFNLSFYKYHGCGNDFIIIDELNSNEISEMQRGEIARVLCKRKYGIGADDVLYLTPSNKADCMMRIFEPDGSEADMCGNGLRCVAALLASKFGRDPVTIETVAGTKLVQKTGELYRVDMGELKTAISEISKFLHINARNNTKFLDRKIFVKSLGEIEVSIVSVGEPHVLVFVNDAEKEDLFSYAEGIAKNKELFPYGINVDLVQVLNASTIQMRTYERGVWDETMACGTGATAAAAVCYITGRVKNARIKVITRGGELTSEIIGGSLFLIGPATRVYSGHVCLKL